jgi:hypothetical protein
LKTSIGTGFSHLEYRTAQAAAAPRRTGAGTYSATRELVDISMSQSICSTTASGN